MDRTRPLPSYQTRLSAAEITLGDRRIPYQVIRSTRASTVRLRVSPGEGLTVVVPPGVHPREVPPLLQAKAAWVLKHWSKLQAAPASPASSELRSGDLLLYRGRTCPLKIHTTPFHPAVGTLPLVRLGPGVIEIWTGPAGAAGLRQHLLAWYRREAQRIIPDRVAALASALGYRYGRITIRDQRTRWGSCSARGNLNFNWRLVMAPPEVLDYVSLHELCHLQELNHSPRFWRLVGRVCPQYQTYRLWLRQYGPHLTIPYVPPDEPPGN